MRIKDTRASCSYTLRARLLKVAFDLSSYGAVRMNHNWGLKERVMGSIYGGILGMTELAGDVCAEEVLKQTMPSKLLQPY